MAKDDHIIARPTPPHMTLECLHCGDTHVVHTPCAVDMALAQMKAFERIHKTCKAQPATEPQRTNP